VEFTSTVEADPLVGRVVDGRYEVTARLARGGMATVYVALDKRLDREVALKVMHPHLADDEQFIARFHREAKSAARMSPPNVVQVVDQGTDADVVYLAMELVPGRTLRDLLDERGALTPRETLDILEPVTDALAAAHRTGIVHRDVKPENVLLTEDGRVKVADFGLARAATTSQTGTTTGMLIGTVAYLSPELVLRGVADARSDVDAVGILLFEMLTGRRPFTGDVPIQVAYQHVNSQVPAPSTLDAGIPAALDEVVTRATARDPDERPVDARELYAELLQARGDLTEPELDREPDGVPEAAETTESEPAPGRTLALRRPTREQPEDTAEQDWAEPVPAQGRRRFGRRALVAVIALLVLALLAGAGAWYFTSGPGAYTTAPSLAGQKAGDAAAALRAQGPVPELLPRYDEQVEAGLVIDTQPPGGEQVRKGGTVRVFVSQGSAFVQVPDLTGKARADAEKALADGDLTLGKVSEEFSETVKKGVVVSQSVKPGEKLKRGEAVALVVSKGRQPITVPQVTGQARAAALKAIDDAGLKASVNEEFSESVKAGLVISQSPADGTLFRGDTVSLVVSKGPPLVEVPAVRGKQLDEARQILDAAGFRVDVKRLVFGGFDTVLATDPPAGRKVPKGSLVTLQVV
jgi:serine/threonine-protein kinase